MSDFATIADWASMLGLLVSVAGLCITIWVWLRIGRIEQHYVRQALLPNYLRKLGGELKNLEHELRDNNRTQVVNILALSQSILQDLLPSLSGERSHRVSQVIREIDGLRRSSSDATFLTQCEHMNASLKALLNSLKSFHQELRWRMRDAK